MIDSNLSTCETASALSPDAVPAPPQSLGIGQWILRSILVILGLGFGAFVAIIIAFLSGWIPIC